MIEGSILVLSVFLFRGYYQDIILTTYYLLLELANMPVCYNGIQYLVSCSTGHEFESKIKLISGKIFVS